MVNSNAHVEVEKWIREVELPKLFNQKFKQKSLMLKSGGEYKYNAVSDDDNIIAMISTRTGETPNGKVEEANLQKIRSEVYWVLMIEQRFEKMLLVLTEPSMINLIKQEKKKDRFPKEIEILRVKLPRELAQKIAEEQNL